jgi:hypothetical protein
MTESGSSSIIIPIISRVACHEDYNNSVRRPPKGRPATTNLYHKEELEKVRTLSGNSSVSQLKSATKKTVAILDPNNRDHVTDGTRNISSATASSSSNNSPVDPAGSCSGISHAEPIRPKTSDAVLSSSSLNSVSTILRAAAGNASNPSGAVAEIQDSDSEVKDIITTKFPKIMDFRPLSSSRTPKSVRR